MSWLLQDVREWLFWMLWFSSSGLLRLLETVGREHFEHVSTWSS